MERQLGVRLVDRTTRAVQPTAAGRRLAPVVERVLLELDGAMQEIGGLADAARRSLRIAATPLVSSQLLPKLLALFRESHPHIQVRLLDAGLGEVERAVLADEADLGLGFFFKASPGLARAPVGNFNFMRVTPGTGTPRAVGRVPWTSLRSAQLIGLPPDNPIQKSINAQLGKLGISVDDLQSVSFFSTLISMVEAGFGTAVMPTFALAACRRHDVHADILVAPKSSLPFYKVTKRGVCDSEAIDAFAELLRQQLPSMSS